MFKRHLRTFPAEFVANKIGYISRDVGPSSSMNVATKILDFKPNLDAFQTLTKCFLCLRKKAEKTTNTAVWQKRIRQFNQNKNEKLRHKEMFLSVFLQKHTWLIFILVIGLFMKTLIDNVFLYTKVLLEFWPLQWKLSESTSQEFLIPLTIHPFSARCCWKPSWERREENRRDSQVATRRETFKCRDGK